MVNWPEGCGARLDDNEWVEFKADTGKIFARHTWGPDKRYHGRNTLGFQPDVICGSNRGVDYWKYYYIRCTRRLGYLW